MCGIAGIQTADHKEIPPGALESLQKTLFHRGPDAQSHIVVASTGLVTTRLAIIDLAHGDQPLYSREGLVLVANGEIYNSPELRATLPDYPFRTGSDCETILPLIEAHDLDFIDHLRGMFAVAIVDPATGRLTIARDQFGIKPLYIVEGPDFFAFASEIECLLQAGFAERAIDDVGRAEFFQTKYVWGSKTIIPHIHRVEPGEVIVVEGGRIRHRRRGKSWPPLAAAPAGQRTSRFGWRPPESVLNQFESVIFDSVAVHLRSDVPWRLYYSGGIDSTILMVAASKVAAAPPEALTIGYEGNDAFDESREALRLARGAMVPCERIEMTARDFWQFAPQIAAASDDPMADPAILPLFMLGRETSRQGAKVAVCGEGGDEIFAGYSRYQRARLPSFLRRNVGRRGVFSGMPGCADRFANWSAAHNRLESEQSAVWPSRMQVLQAIDILERLPNCLLIKLDRALMANGVEGRTPFLDREVMTFATTLPDRYRAVPGQGKRLLRDWLARAYPEAKPYARKRGFGVPLAKWMHARRDELGRLVSAQPGIRQVFEPAAVTDAFAQCLSDDQPAWSMLFYALWHSRHILRLGCEADISAVLTDAARAG